MNLERSSTCDRKVATSPVFTAINNDCVLECRDHAENSIDCIISSLPFGNQYEYSPSYLDFGHNPTNEDFFKQMDFLIPELLRVLQPGRLCCIHAKDRIRFGAVTGDGMPTVDPFSDDTVRAFRKHGFRFCGRITIDTDVVRENAQTYRLGWSENAKDSTKMGCGMPEYVLLFRKLPSDTSRAYADVPVTKDKEEYLRSDWQLDAAGFWRSCGNRLPDPDFMADMDMQALGRWWKDYCLKGGYDYKEHVQLAKVMENAGRLPSSFMLFPPISRNKDVWTDIARMRTLNSEQERNQQRKHLCIARGSLVITRAGHVPIESIRAGEYVLTHKGRWRRVMAVKCMGIKDVIKLEAGGVPGLICTPDHRLLSRSCKGKGGGRGNWPPGAMSHPRKNALTSVPAWTEAQETLASYVNLPLAEIEPSELTALEWWVIGRWLGDGHYGGRNELYISCAFSELKELKKSLCGLAGAVHATPSVYQIRIHDKCGRLRGMIARCGRRCEGKLLPAPALALNAELSESLLSGYLSADGHYVKIYDRWTASSVSRALLLGMAMVAQRARGVSASVYAGRPPGICTIEGRTMKTRQDWILGIPPKNLSAFLLDDGAWKKVRQIRPIPPTEVWDIQVDEDESFIAEGCVVHNCPLQIDVIERLITRYTNKGEIVLDPFAGIFSVPYVAIKMERIGVGIELCEEYWRNGVGYCEMAEQKATAPTLFDMSQFKSKNEGKEDVSGGMADGEPRED